MGVQVFWQYPLLPPSNDPRCQVSPSDRKSSKVFGDFFINLIFVEKPIDQSTNQSYLSLRSIVPESTTNIALYISVPRSCKESKMSVIASHISILNKLYMFQTKLMGTLTTHQCLIKRSDKIDFPPKTNTCPSKKRPRPFPASSAAAVSLYSGVCIYVYVYVDHHIDGRCSTIYPYAI